MEILTLGEGVRAVRKFSKLEPDAFRDRRRTVRQDAGVPSLNVENQSVALLWAAAIESMVWGQHQTTQLGGDFLLLARETQVWSQPWSDALFDHLLTSMAGKARSGPFALEGTWDERQSLSALLFVVFSVGWDVSVYFSAMPTRAVHADHDGLFWFEYCGDDDREAARSVIENLRRRV